MLNFYNFFQSAKLDIQKAAYLDIGKEWKSMVNDFKHVRLYYIRSGCAELTLTNKTVTLEEGYLYFIPAFSILEGNCKNHMGHYFVHIIPDILTEHFFKILPLKSKCFLERDIADYLFLTIIKNNEQNSLHSRQATDSALKLLFSYFFEGINIEENDVGKFADVFEYIDTHIGEKIYIKDLSALVYLDDAYFSNLFKKTFGISLQQHILLKRVDRAKELLATNATISEISNQLGFFDAASFSNFFKKQTTMSPKTFRKHLFE
ncbi:helix-turn-helix domain-containing protein [Pumilibacter intestinalis]|uniref:helix-turn-helix domain-containing protein n=1 Tax=Pumilibacter intestinalis TaxID=2941511 RepID=UPI00203B0293|nr:AraC family transcriptional regulator [Pumilibacter intestinalis]